jgi:hypothetical protein
MNRSPAMAGERGLFEPADARFRKRDGPDPAAPIMTAPDHNEAFADQH